ncbi:hypothetical protein BV20DRAFT_974525 [Pilatotrama ljubarskyi]|nr:hypothetical protein BV20DRAFT_974525 [Pilatotrama ljubarskyi]
MREPSPALETLAALRAVHTESALIAHIRRIGTSCERCPGENSYLGSALSNTADRWSAIVSDTTAFALAF